MCFFTPFITSRGHLWGMLKYCVTIWMFPKIGVPQNEWFIMENPIKMDDLGFPLFLETPICYLCLFKLCFIFFLYGRPLFTTIWRICPFSNHLKQIKA